MVGSAYEQFRRKIELIHRGNPEVYVLVKCLPRGGFASSQRTRFRRKRHERSTEDPNVLTTPVFRAPPV